VGAVRSAARRLVMRTAGGTCSICSSSCDRTEPAAGGPGSSTTPNEQTRVRVPRWRAGLVGALTASAPGGEAPMLLAVRPLAAKLPRWSEARTQGGTGRGAPGSRASVAATPPALPPARRPETPASPPRIYMPASTSHPHSSRHSKFACQLFALPTSIVESQEPTLFVVRAVASCRSSLLQLGGGCCCC